MRWLIASIAVIGFVASGLALREHYRTDASPCSINEKWDCGAVNKSPYAVIHGVPVADIGLAGYLLLAILAIRRSWKLLAAASVPALAFSLYLANIEAHELGVWCVYCVISLGAISLITLLGLGMVVMQLIRKPAAKVPGAEPQ